MNRCYEAMNNDFNSPMVIAELFEASRIVNAVKDGHATLTAEDIDLLKSYFSLFFHEILGIRPENFNVAGKYDEAMKKVMDLLLSIRQDAKANKNWAVSDKIRDELKSAGITVKDTKEGSEWSLE